MIGATGCVFATLSKSEHILRPRLMLLLLLESPEEVARLGNLESDGGGEETVFI